MFTRYAKYDYRVQLMRIFACFAVIGCHVRIEPVINGGLDKHFLLLHGFYDDGVAIFFMIIGFFLSEIKEPFWKSVGKTFLRILLPVFALKCCIQIFDAWIVGEASLLQCLANPSIRLMETFRQFVTLNFAEGNFSSHLWYITSYLRIVVLFPVLKLLALNTPAASKVLKWFLLINVISMFVNDFQAIVPFSFGNLGYFVIFDVSVTYVIIGFILYQRQALLEYHWRYRVLFFSGLFGVNLLRFFLQCILFQQSLEKTYFYYWNTTVSLLFSVCFIGFFLTFPRNVKHMWTAIVNYIGAKTYCIYLIHMAVYTFLNHRNIRSWVISVTFGNRPNLITKLGYNVLYPTIIFVCCLLIALCLDCIKAIVIHPITTWKKKH